MVFNPRKVEEEMIGSSLELEPQKFRYGGGGGESNSPSRKRLPEYPTSLVSSFSLAWLSSADRIQPSQPILLIQSLSASELEHLDFVTPSPGLRGEAEMDLQPYLGCNTN